MTDKAAVTRRTFLCRSGAAMGLGVSQFLGCAPAVLISDRQRPAINWGVASGDVTTDSAVIWSRTNRLAQMIVEYAATESFKQAQRVSGALASEASGFTARVELQGLPAGQQIFYRVAFGSLESRKALSEWVYGTFRTASDQARRVQFAFSADTAGQGFGINPEWGGMRLYETIRATDPDFFIHSGDRIYADGPISSEVTLDDGSVWRNVVTPAKSKVAETLDEFRGNYDYNLLDNNVRRLSAQVPQFVQWDDHEVVNNWYPGEILDDDRYTIKDVSLLAKRARKAFFDYTPMRLGVRRSQRIYRTVHYGPLLDVILLDMRTYRGPNGPNRQTSPGPDTQCLGTTQLDWLKKQLQGSRAVWKIVAADMPLGLVVPDGKHAIDNVANVNGSPRGREFEIAELLGFIKSRNIKNVAWVTADVHYAAAHYYDPTKAAFKNFDGFWEFVAGPMNAGTFPPKALDDTFGPQVMFQSVPNDLKPSRPPSDGMQYFGSVTIEPEGTMSVSLHDLAGAAIYRVELKPDGVDGSA